MSIQFANPSLLSLLLIIPVLAAWSWWCARRRHHAGLRYANVAQASASRRTSWRLLLRKGLPPMRWLALAFLIVTLARPQTVDAQQSVKGQGIDIALALDISGSMAALDFEPQNRLEAAKGVIDDFVADRPFDRIGLAIFAGEAFSQCPLTHDHAVLARLLGDVKLSSDLGINDGTAIGMGLANAANMLKESDAKSKVVVLLTDGVNTAGQIDPITAAEAAQSLGIKVYTIGVGRPGPVPVPRRTMLGEEIFMMDNILDEAMLQEIAEMTGGLYFRAEDTDGLQQIYDEINELETSEIEIRTFHRYGELAGWLLFPALALIVAEAGLRHTCLRKLP